MHVHLDAACAACICSASPHLAYATYTDMCMCMLICMMLHAPCRPSSSLTQAALLSSSMCKSWTLPNHHCCLIAHHHLPAAWMQHHWRPHGTLQSRSPQLAAGGQMLHAFAASLLQPWQLWQHAGCIGLAQHTAACKAVSTAQICCTPSTCVCLSMSD